MRERISYGERKLDDRRNEAGAKYRKSILAFRKLLDEEKRFMLQ